MTIGNKTNEKTALKEIGFRISKVRLKKNITQSKLAFEAGVSESTIKRLENGEPVKLDSLFRILSKLELAENFEEMIPAPSLSPIELHALKEKENSRVRASSKTENNSKETIIWNE